MSYLINLAERGQNTILGAELVERGERIREQLAIYADLRDQRAALDARWAIRLGHEVTWLESWGEEPHARTHSRSELMHMATDIATQSQDVLAVLVKLLSDEEV